MDLNFYTESLTMDYYPENWSMNSENSVGKKWVYSGTYGSVGSQVSYQFVSRIDFNKESVFIHSGFNLFSGYYLTWGSANNPALVG